MKNRILKFSVVYAAVMVVTLILFCIGSVKDEAIAAKLMLGNNFFTKACEAVGKFPLYIAVAFGCSILHYHAEHKQLVWHRRLLKAVYVAGGVISFTLMMTDIFDMILSHKLLSYAASFFAAIGLYTSLCFYTERLDDERLIKYKKWAVAIVAAGAAIVLMTAICKIAWGRPRPYEVASGEYMINSGAVFSPWYKINRQGGSSFFSRHSACVMGIFAFIPLLIADERKKITVIIFAAVSSAVALIVILSRLLMGAHYLTDVSVGVMVAATAMYVASVVAFGPKGMKIDPDGKLNKYL